jgi:hypothetical protein
MPTLIKAEYSNGCIFFKEVEPGDDEPFPVLSEYPGDDAEIRVSCDENDERTVVRLLSGFDLSRDNVEREIGGLATASKMADQIGEIYQNDTFSLTVHDTKIGSFTLWIVHNNPAYKDLGS